MNHNRKYLTGTIDLLKTRLNHSLEMIDQNRIEFLLKTDSFFENVPFKLISLVYRYGFKNELIPQYQKVGKKYQELPISLELKMEILEWADQNNLQLLYNIHMIGALEALIHVGNKYHLSVKNIEVERRKYATIPETIEECKSNYDSYPENHLISLYKLDPIHAIKEFASILNKNERYEKLKTYIHKIPKEIIVKIINGQLEKSQARKPECDELLAIIDKKKA